MVNRGGREGGKGGKEGGGKVKEEGVLAMSDISMQNFACQQSTSVVNEGVSYAV